MAMRKLSHFLYSDGLTETRNSSGDQFGSERIADVVSRNSAASAAEIATSIAHAATQCGTTTDDLTIMVCCRISEELWDSHSVAEVATANGAGMSY